VLLKQLAGKQIAIIAIFIAIRVYRMEYRPTYIPFLICTILGCDVILRFLGILLVQLRLPHINECGELKLVEDYLIHFISQ